MVAQMFYAWVAGIYTWLADLKCYVGIPVDYADVSMLVWEQLRHEGADHATAILGDIVFFLGYNAVLFTLVLIGVMCSHIRARYKLLILFGFIILVYILSMTGCFASLSLNYQLNGSIFGYT